MFLRSIIGRLFPSAWEPAQEPHSYPFDFDGSQRYSRNKTGLDVFPFVGGDGTIGQIGSVSGFMPQLDQFVWAQGTGKKPFGPFSTTQPVNVEWQMTVPGLGKVV